MYKGAIIKETLADELLLDHVMIDKVDIWKTSDPTLKYWTMIWFRSEVAEFPSLLAEAMINGWYADMKKGNTKYIVFKDKVLQYEIGNIAEKEAVLDYCRSLGIPDQQLKWSE